jgi:hypothetical protein
MADGLQWRNAWTCTYSIVQGILDGESVDFCSAMQEHELNAMERLRLIKLEVSEGGAEYTRRHIR